MLLLCERQLKLKKDVIEVYPKEMWTVEGSKAPKIHFFFFVYTSCKSS